MTETTRDESGPLRESEGLSLPLRISELSGRKALRFQLTPTPEARATLAADLGIERVRKLDFRGALASEGRHDWRLEGQLGATVVQDCVITGAPVSTRIDTRVIRRFLRDMPEPTEAEFEIPEDDTVEPLGSVIDPGAVMVEALALALPEYPRAPGAELPAVASDDDGVDERPNPFAALAALRRDPE